MRVTAAVFILLCAYLSAAAHEYWFEADNFVVKLHQSTAVRLFSGEALNREKELPFQPSRTRSFDIYSLAGKFDTRTMAETDATPMLIFSSDLAGTYMLSMERDWAYITLPADKFEAYLRDEGMGYIADERKRIGETEKPGRERYSRYLKSLLQVGENITGNIKTRIGTKLEIVPLDNPYSKKFGGTSTFQFWFDSRPLDGYTVFVDNREGDKITTQKLTTDKDGKVAVKLDRRGIWLVRVVYMQRCPRNCGESDWESFWGALTFGVR